MRNEGQQARDRSTEKNEDAVRAPAPSASYRRRAWIEFQRALDPLAPVKPLPPQRP
jgi:hypothetical protein